MNVIESIRWRLAEEEDERAGVSIETVLLALEAPEGWRQHACEYLGGHIGWEPAHLLAFSRVGPGRPVGLEAVLGALRAPAHLQEAACWRLLGRAAWGQRPLTTELLAASGVSRRQHYPLLDLDLEGHQGDIVPRTRGLSSATVAHLAFGLTSRGENTYLVLNEMDHHYSDNGRYGRTGATPDKYMPLKGYEGEVLDWTPLLLPDHNAAPAQYTGAVRHPAALVWVPRSRRKSATYPLSAGLERAVATQRRAQPNTEQQLLTLETSR